VELKLDGGNLLFYKDYCFSTTRILSDNSTLTQVQVENILLDKTGKKLILFDELEDDKTGHINAMISVLFDKYILINHLDPKVNKHLDSDTIEQVAEVINKT